jgi:methanogenic corrinoid protein MtbC1
MVESCVRTVRQVSRNRAVGIMVGGPAFVVQPSLAGQVGADGYATDGREAPVVAEKLLAEMPDRT